MVCPCHVTVDPVVILVPAMVSGTELLLPAVAADGTRPLMCGAGLMVNVEGAAGVKELLPAAFTTWIWAVPCAARSEDGTVANREVALEYRNVSAVVPEPLIQFTVDLLVNPVPAMVTVTPAVLPAVAVDGVRPVTAGGSEAIVNGLGLELPKSAVTTVMLPVPAAVRSEEGAVAVMEVALEYNELSVVGVPAPGSEPVGVQVTVDPLVKLVPVMVTVAWLLPALTDAGLRIVIAGAGLIVKSSAFGVVMLLFTTLTGTVTGVDPELAIMPGVIVHVRLVVFTTVVVWAVPFHKICGLETNPVPCTVSVNWVRPAVA